MKVKVRQRKDNGRVTWTTDIHVTPKGEEAPERFRLSAPPSVTSKSGAERWAGEQARLIAANGRPYSTKKARETRAAKAAAEAAAKAAEAPTLAAFFPKFLEHCTAERRKGSTLETYALVARLHLLPRLGHLALDKISELDVQRVKAALVEGKPSHVNVVLSVLTGTLKLARVHYPTVTIPPIKRVKKDGEETLRFYSREEAAALVAAVQHHPVRLATILLALDAGLRKGEVHALRWHDIDEKRNELNVRHTLYRGTLVSPKNGKPRRVPMTARLLAALRALPRDSEWLLPRGVQTKPGVATRSACTPVSLRFVLSSTAKRAGVPDHGPHSLRHTFASLLLASGGDLRTLQALLGHGSLVVTARYTHLMPGADRSAVARLEAFATAEPVPPATVTDLAQARKKRGAEA